MTEAVHHTPQQCSIKLTALLDKLQNIDTRNTQTLPQLVDDAKVLASELARETEFIDSLHSS